MNIYELMSNRIKVTSNNNSIITKQAHIIIMNVTLIKCFMNEFLLPGREEHDEVCSCWHGIIKHLHRVRVFGMLVLVCIIFTTNPSK